MIQLKTAPRQLQQALVEVEATLYRYADQQPQMIGEGLRNLIAGGGKRIRPLLCLLGIYFGPKEAVYEDVIELATMPELLHMASLIHDDIIDQADARRGIETLHKRYGTHVAVYSGDLVIIDTLHRMLRYYEREDYLRFTDDLVSLVRSEILQMEGKTLLSLSAKRYLRIIEGKTARLLKLSLEMGAVFSGVPQPLQQQLLRAVHSMGMAFQIIDDCLDYSSQAKALGKPIFQDLQNGYMTLPAIFHCHRVPEFYTMLKAKGPGKLKRLSAKQFEPDVAKALDLARRYNERALKAIEALPDHPMKAPLRELAMVLASRNS